MAAPRPAKPKARLRLVAHQDGDRIAMRTPFDAMLVQEIKASLPHGSRKWDATLKGWFFQMSYHAALVGMLQRIGYEVVYPDTSIFPELGDAGTAPPPAPAAGPAPSRPTNGGGRPSGAAAQDDRFFNRKYATTEDWAVLHLIEGAPAPVAKAAYRALMGMSHPDQGGSAVDAQRVNVAWQRIEKTLAEET